MISAKTTNIVIIAYKRPFNNWEAMDVVLMLFIYDACRDIQAESPIHQARYAVAEPNFQS